MLDMTSNLDKIIKIFKMTGCAVRGCRSNNNKKLLRNNGANKIKVNFHRFPKNKRLCDLWLRLCGRRDYTFNIIHAKICSEHFLADCYERNLQHELLSITPKCRKLKSNAVPTERLPNTGRLKPKLPNYLGKRICHRRNATETNTYEDENSQPEQNQIIIRPSIIKEEKKFYNQPILPKPVAKPIKFVFVNATPPPPQPQLPPLQLNTTAATIAKQIITTTPITNEYTPILRSTLMLPPGTTIKQIPNMPNDSEEHQTNNNYTTAPNEEDKSPEDESETIQSGMLFYKIKKHKKMNLAINKERLEIEQSRQKYHELIANKIFAMLVKCDGGSGSGGGGTNSDDNNLSYCNIKQEI